MDPGRARLDERLHELEGIERAAEAGLGVGDDGCEPVRAVLPLGRVDLVGAEQRTVDALHERGRAVSRVEALIRIRLSREVGVRSDLPAGEVDGLQAGLDHLHGLRAGHRAERGDVVLRVEEPPEPLCPEPGQRVLDAESATDPLDLVVAVGPLDSRPAAVRLPSAHLDTSQPDCVQRW